MKLTSEDTKIRQREPNTTKTLTLKYYMNNLSINNNIINAGSIK